LAPRKQALHPGGRRLPGLLGHLPAVLALDRAEQPRDVGAHPPTRLRPPEPRRHPRVQRIEIVRPAPDLMLVH